MAKAKIALSVLAICGAMLLGGCGAPPSTSTDRESTVSAASDISAEPSLVPLTFEKNVRVTVLGVQIKFDENEKLKDLLDTTGLTLSEEDKSRSVEVYGTVDIKLNGQNVLRIGVMNRQKGDAPLLECQITSIKDIGKTEHLLTVNGYSVGSHPGLTWEEALESFGFTPTSPDKSYVHKNDSSKTTSVWGVLGDDSARVELEESKGLKDSYYFWRLNIEFPDTGRYLWLSARNQDNADDNGVSAVLIGYNA